MSMKTLALIAAMLLASCAAAQDPPTDAETALAASAGIDLSIALKVKRLGTSIQRLTATTPQYDQIPAAGLVLSTRAGEGRTVLAKVRSSLEGTGYNAYLLSDAFGMGPDAIAVTKADDLAYLAIVRTNGINYDLEHAKVMDRYQQWSQKYGLRLVGAGQDWLEAEFTNPPKDWDAFAAEVYAFCPDAVDQGSGTVSELASEMKSGNIVYLWWD